MNFYRADCKRSFPRVMGNESKSSFDDGDGESDENEEDRKLLSRHKPSEKQNRIKFGPTQSFRVKSDRDHNDKVNISSHTDISFLFASRVGFQICHKYGLAVMAGQMCFLKLSLQLTERKLGNVLTHSLTSPGPRTRHQHSLFPETGSAPEAKFDVEAVKLNHGR